MSTIQKLIGALPKLSLEDRSRLGQALNALKSFSGGKKSVTIEEELKSDKFLDIVMEAMVEVLRQGSIDYISVSKIKRSNLYNTFAEEVSRLEEYVDEMKFNAVEQRAFMLVSLKLLHKYLQNGVPVRWDKVNKYLVRTPKIAISSREMMIFIHLVPAVINMHFPGYVVGGLAKWIIRKELPNVRNK